MVDGAAVVGGMAGSFEVSGVPVDYGSHRLHPECAPEILNDLHRMLGDDLLLRPRHGRIRLGGRWLRFPLDPLNLATNLPLGVSLGAMLDFVRRRGSRAPRRETFASVMLRGVGRTLCDAFYFPYARKVWGVEPDELSAVQATKRLVARTPRALLAKVASALPGFRDSTSRKFYYPRGGYGQIATALSNAAQQLGAEVLLGTKVNAVRLHDTGAEVEMLCDGQTNTVTVDYVWSTIPMKALLGLLDPKPPAGVLAAADSLRTRAMVLGYLTLATDRFSEFDAHYFPEGRVAISRLSEPKNYGLASSPFSTVLCAELPTDIGSEVWSAEDRDIQGIVIEAMRAAGLHIDSAIAGFTTRRIPYAYPIYDVGYERSFDIVDDWMSGLARVVTFGRQGLYAHNNVHHVLEMAYAAAESLSPDGSFDRARWTHFRTAFDRQVVVD